jgi:hypothetical protein
LLHDKQEVLMRLLMAVLSVSLAAACTPEAEVVDDPSMYLTGTEEEALRAEDGSFSCESPKKVLICHIPPGNPDNAHTICVGEPGVRAHERNHGDLIGACDDGGEQDAGVPVEPDATPVPEPDATPVPEPDASPDPGPDGGGVD